MQLENIGEDAHSNARDGKVDVKTPSPCHLAGEDATEDGADSASRSPDDSHGAKVHTYVC